MKIENGNPVLERFKEKAKSEGAVELYEKIVQLKMKAPDGKMRMTDVANTEQLLDPEQTIDRALETYLKKGYLNYRQKMQIMLL